MNSRSPSYREGGPHRTRTITNAPDCVKMKPDRRKPPMFAAHTLPYLRSACVFLLYGFLTWLELRQAIVGPYLPLVLNTYIVFKNSTNARRSSGFKKRPITPDFLSLLNSWPVL
jgi:hypothetical protein